MALAAFVADWRLARLLCRRATRKADQWVIERRADGTLWAAGSAQNLGYAIRAMFSRKASDEFHFYRVRRWHGLLVASRRVFWLPGSVVEFRLVHRATMFELAPWPLLVECRKIDQRRAGDDALDVPGFLRRLNRAA